ncbi:hypothetical protein CEXT_340051 [Caerostris extrusa]|uniref:Transposase n=1 Tax=Caerostris extrusa TaxID=172846 RepID=A0AAV4TIK7_CAEEX|nr:hypothetical protein CEXT_340051 [Caerostris extrusa]
MCTQCALEKEKNQQTVFRNPSRIMTDTGTAFTSNGFHDYCKTEESDHVAVTTGVSRAMVKLNVFTKQ